MGIADAKSGTGIIMSNLGKFDEGLKNCMDAVKLYDQLLRSSNIRDKSIILRKQSYAYNSAGIIYSQQGNYPEALKNLYAALKIREETGDKKGVSYTQNNIAIIYFTQHNYAGALKYFSASLK
ncbi:MAG: tetratricopeptide repeat protein [Bacteroidota bacterium]